MTPKELITALEKENLLLRAALRQSVVALDEMSECGSFYYIENVQKQNRIALKKGKK